MPIPFVTQRLNELRAFSFCTAFGGSWSLTTRSPLYGHAIAEHREFSLSNRGVQPRRATAEQLCGNDNTRNSSCEIAPILFLRAWGESGRHISRTRARARGVMGSYS